MQADSDDIDAQVRTGLASCRGNWPDLATRSGISYSWITKFANGHIENPGVGTLRKIRDALNGATPPAADQQAAGG